MITRIHDAAGQNGRPFVRCLINQSPRGVNLVFMSKDSGQSSKPKSKGGERDGPPGGVCVDMLAWLERVAEEQVTTGLAREGLHSYHKLLQVGRSDANLLERTHVRMAEVLLQGGDQHRAETHLSEAVRINPNNAYAFCLLGRVHLDLHEWEQAADCGYTACRLEPGSSDYHQLLGRALLCDGEWSTGCSELQSAIDLDPDNVIAVCDMAMAYAQQLRFDDGEQLLVETMDRHPANTVLRDAMASVQQYKQTVKMRRAVAKGRSRSGKGASETRFARSVHELIEDSFARKGYKREHVDGALRLLEDAVDVIGLSVRNPAVMAAACEYAVTKLSGETNVTQTSLADQYGVSAAAISSRYRVMVERLGLMPGDRRYTSPGN
jgi:Flp pilus assembly protein TadD